MNIKKLANELDGKLQVTQRGYGKHIPIIISYFKQIQDNKQPTKKQQIIVFILCFLSLILGMNHAGDIGCQYEIVGFGLGSMIIGFVFAGLLFILMEKFRKEKKIVGGKK